MEKELVSVVFTFKDGSNKALAGKELEEWEIICYSHSDYLLPGDTDHVLASRYGGIVRGFVPPTAISAKSTGAMKKKN